MGFRKIGEPFSSIGHPIGKSGGGGFQWEQVANFESGFVTPNPSGFDTITEIGGVTIVASAAAALRGDYGAQANLVGPSPANSGYGSLTGPNNESFLACQYLFDPNTLVMGAGERFGLCSSPGSGPGSVAWYMELIKGAPYTLSLYYGTDGAGNLLSGTHNITDEEHFIQVEWKASSAVGANNGFVRLFVDGVLRTETLFIDNDQHDSDSLRFGGLFGIDAGTSGAIYFDNIKWTNQENRI